ncbi:MAG: YkgJ family cysteine cluster protein [Desulfobulbus sp.]|nr:YkgJ family cysteine cluster protein [Desulfobulbus sp.]
MSSNTSCKRCGICCRQGGPALHGPDMKLIRSGHIQLDDLITVRRGELAFQPLSTCPEPVRHEFLKLAGQSGTWCCVFFDENTNACRRYAHRPVACSLLDCTDTKPILDIVGQDLLTRFDCLSSDDPLLPLIREHERICPCPDLEKVRQTLDRPEAVPALLADLQIAVHHDLAYRTEIIQRYQLSLARELFAFGRPLFQLLLPLGIHNRHTSKGVSLTLSNC